MSDSLNHSDDIVTVTVQIYDIKLAAEARYGYELPRIASVFIGIRGLRTELQHHAEHVRELPATLLHWDGNLTIGTVIDLQMPRWLAAKKGFKYRE